MSRLYPSLLALLAAASLPAAAQPPKAPEKPPSLFQQLVPRATEKNGFEEFVLAAELAQANRRWLQVEAEGGTLREKREVLADPKIRRALLLIDQGLAKPVRQPREKLTFASEFPELGPFRSLARLLTLRQYVLFADGRTTEAIRGARTLLRFSRALPKDTLIHSLVELGMNGLAIRSMAERLDQLSAQDCELLFQVCREWLAQPDPTVTAVIAERDSVRGTLAEWAVAAKQQGVRKAVQEFFGAEEEALQQAEPLVRELAAGGPEAIDRLFADATRKLDDYYRQVLEELRKPPWARTIPAAMEADDGTPSGWAAVALTASMDRIDRTFMRSQAQMRLLAVHCAIRRHRWEHDRLPKTLDELRLGDLVIDPFTGAALKYEPDVHTYRLASVGPKAFPDNPAAVDGHVPISIIPGGR